MFYCFFILHVHYTPYHLPPYSEIFKHPKWPYLWKMESDSPIKSIYSFKILTFSSNSSSPCLPLFYLTCLRTPLSRITVLKYSSENLSSQVWLKLRKHSLSPYLFILQFTSFYYFFIISVSSTILSFTHLRNVLPELSPSFLFFSFFSFLCFFNLFYSHTAFCISCYWNHSI